MTFIGVDDMLNKNDKIKYLLEIVSVFFKGACVVGAINVLRDYETPESSLFFIAACGFLWSFKSFFCFHVEKREEP